MPIQICLVAVYQPIWFHFNPVGVTHEIILGCLHFISRLWFMTFKVKNNWPTLDVFYKTCSGANMKSWKNESKQKECMTLWLESEQSSSRASLCIFTTGASLASYVLPCQGLVYTASNRSCNFWIKKTSSCDRSASRANIQLWISRGHGRALGVLLKELYMGAEAFEMLASVSQK